MPISTTLATIKQTLSKSTDSASLDAELLLTHVLNKPRSFLYAWPEHELTVDQIEQLETLVQRRLQGEPIAHLLGRREFWSLDLLVTPDTLIPRPETELLVERVLADHTGNTLRVLDLGTGSGAIALALASEKPSWSLLATDKSVAALAVARENAANLQLCNVEFLQSDWFSALASQTFDVIVSNPPYIRANDPHLTEGDVRFDPRSALVAADNGLADIHHIVAKASDYLTPHGCLYLEHGYDQGAAVREIFMQYRFEAVATHQDLSGQARITFGWKKN